MTIRRHTIWKCPVCSSEHSNDWRLASHIGGMACTYDDHHREWARVRDSEAHLYDMGTAASILRPFVIDEISPDSSPPLELDDGTDIQRQIDELKESLSDLKSDLGEHFDSPITNLLEGFEIIANIELDLYSFLLEELKLEYGEDVQEWWTNGVPRKIRSKCAQRAEEDDNRCNRWEYLDLIDLKDIIESKWTLLSPYAEAIPRFPGKKQFLQLFVRVNSLRNIVMHPLKGKPLEPEDFELLRGFSESIDQFIQAAE